MTMEVKQVAGPEGYAAVLPLAQEYWQEQLTWDRRDDPWTVAEMMRLEAGLYLRCASEQHAVFVAHDGQELFGYAVCSMETVKLVKGGIVGLIDDIYCAKAATGTTEAGHKLYFNCLGWFRHMGVRYVEAAVHLRNLRVATTMPRIGFEPRYTRYRMDLQKERGHGKRRTGKRKTRNRSNSVRAGAVGPGAGGAGKPGVPKKARADAGSAAGN